LEFNRRADGSSFFTPELRAFFESQGARIVRWKACLLRIRLSGRDSSRYEICRAGASPAVPWQPERLPYSGRLDVTISNLSNPSPAVAQF
jgi:hypothetical protein